MAEYIERGQIKYEQWSVGPLCEPLMVVRKKTIDSIPAADVAPVVRCKDCKHLNILNRKELYAHCSKTNMVFPPFEVDTREHFCSYGERKDGDTNG